MLAAASPIFRFHKDNADERPSKLDFTEYERSFQQNLTLPELTPGQKVNEQIGNEARGSNT